MQPNCLAQQTHKYHQVSSPDFNRQCYFPLIVTRMPSQEYHDQGIIKMTSWRRTSTLLLEWLLCIVAIHNISVFV